MKKTVLAKLIERLNDMLMSARHVIENPSLYHEQDFDEAKKHVLYTEICMQEATELREEERQNLIDACNHNKGVNGWTDGEEYFNNTFEQ